MSLVPVFRRVAVVILTAVGLVMCALLFEFRTSMRASPVAPDLAEQRRELLRRAEVWRAPPVPIERADLSGGDDGEAADVVCRFAPNGLGGTSAKFDCTLENGETIRVKYRGAEVVGEVAATRLLAALGFPADRMSLARRVHCFGCPLEPFLTVKTLTAFRALESFSRGIDYGVERQFTWAAVERRFPGAEIEVAGQEGWAWWEMADARDRLTGEARAHVDAFMLMAVFLAHWDNKPQNQRLVCAAGREPLERRCERPIALMQDVGSTFGPRKVSLEGWRNASVWDNRSTCMTSMSNLPYGGGTFKAVQVSEEGRALLAGLLTRLSSVQILDLFQGARFDERPDASSAGAAAEWGQVFAQKVRQVADGPPCPSIAQLNGHV